MDDVFNVFSTPVMVVHLRKDSDEFSFRACYVETFRSYKKTRAIEQRWIVSSGFLRICNKM
jgi:hypothetical protein